MNAYHSSTSGNRTHNRTMAMLAGALALGGIVTGGWWLANSQSAKAETVTMYKNIGCQCCTRWANTLRAKGHTVVENGVADLDAIKARFHIGEKFQGCHTALIAGYVIEGHVPVKDIERLLKERPDAKGLSVAGMPIGAPGMEAPDQTAEPFTVLLMKKDGTSEVWAKY